MKIESKINGSDIDKYLFIEKVLPSFFDETAPVLSNLANFTAFMKEIFEKISWVGFYLALGESLFLGPFQGKPACVRIDFGKGVCGTSAKERRTIIAPDVGKFPGHIACDSRTKSEIVIPIINNKEIFGVLDIDSFELNSFNEIDEKYLNIFMSIISDKLNLQKYKIA